MTPSSSSSVRPGLPARHWSYKYVALLAAAVAIARCWGNVGLYNHTTDELAHIAGAVGFWETGRNLYMVEHPPLQRIVVGGALRWAGVRYPKAREAELMAARAEERRKALEARRAKGVQGSETEIAKEAPWGAEGVQDRDVANVKGEDIALHGDVDYWGVLAVARRANLVFAALLLLFVYGLGHYLANPLAGMLACVFLSFDPTFLGHAGLVTTDVPAAAGFAAATFYGIRFVGRPTWGRAAAAGVALGLAMACKFTCVLLAPALVALMVLRAVRRARGMGGSPMDEIGIEGPLGRRGTGGPPMPRWRRVVRALPRFRYFVAIAMVAFFCLWATYLFNVGRLEDQELFADDVKGWARIPQGLKEMRVPMPSMPLGVMFMAAIGKSGFSCYFNGHLDFNGHLAYFPEAIAVKSPVGLVAAIVLALVACAVARERRPVLALCVLLPSSLLLLTAMTGRLQIGIRHILPVIPFIYLFVAFYLHRGRWAWALLPLIAVAGVETAGVRGEWLPFFNRAAGGAANGSKYLADSNLDWGQDVARLAAYLKGRGATDYTIKVSGVRVAALVKELGLDPASRERDVEELRARPHGLLALGVNARLGLEDFKRDKEGRVLRGPDYTWVRGYPVVARVGESIEIYDLGAANP